MLAATLDHVDQSAKLVYPSYISPKIDGIRCVTDAHGVAVSRNGKPFNNAMLNAEFAKYKIPYLDGEIGLGDPTEPEFFNRTSAFVRKESRTLEEVGFEKLDYYIFDRISAEGGYEDRFINKLPKLPTDSKINFVILEQRRVLDDEMLIAWEDSWAEKGYEGIIIRANLSAKYKFGRSSLKSAELIKHKRFVDTEATITGFIEAMENLNEKTTDAWGHSTRSSHKENKVGKGMAGVLVCSDPNFEGEVRIGTGIGLTHELKRDMWDNPQKYIGRMITYKYQGGSDYEKVRFGSFKGFRDDGI